MSEPIQRYVAIETDLASRAVIGDKEYAGCVDVVTHADHVAAVAAARAEMESKSLVQAIFHAPDDGARPFVLQRITDVSGVSGTGVVAHGVEFPDGTVALRWVGGNPTSVVFHDNGMASVEAIHGHGGNTRIVWTYEDMGPRAAEMDECEARGFAKGVKTARDAVVAFHKGSCRRYYAENRCTCGLDAAIDALRGES